MESLQALIGLALHASLFLIVLGIGLATDAGDALYVLKRPRLLVPALIAIMVIVPLFAALLVAILPLTPVVKAGIILMAVSPLPPLVQSKAIALGGSKSYVYGLLVAIAALAVIVVPVALAVVSAAFGAHASVDPAAVARMVAMTVFLPLVSGMGLRAVATSAADRAAPVVGKIANLILVIAIVPVLAAAAPAMGHLIGNGTILVIEAVVAVGLAAGHLLGGPDPGGRVALALSSATRHPSIALLIAGSNPVEPAVKAAILLFVIVGLLTAIPYKAWVKRRMLVPRAT